MSDLLIYILKASLIFSLLVTFYCLFLRRLTFHALNRIILLLIIPVSLVLPVLSFGIQSPVIYNDLIEGNFENFGVTEVTSTIEYTSVDFNWSYLEVIYWVGLCFGIALLVFNAFKLFHQLRSSHKTHLGKISIYESRVASVFSCFKWIFVPLNGNYEINHPIIKHEVAHIRLLHSYDLIITELFIAFTWFNPFVYLFRRLLRSVHEFQADEKVLTDSIKKSDYLTLMLEELMYKNEFSFSHNFKSLTIKNRIKMITKNKSQNISKLRYILLLPIIAGILMSFSNLKGTKPSIKPIKEGLYKKISSGYGKRKHPKTKKIVMHHGVDFAADIGTPIQATGDGTIISVKSNKEGHGKQIKIDHGSGYRSSYSHMSKFMVKEGQFVKQGTIIGYSGNSGYSFGPHLHYMIILNGKSVNPANYFKTKEKI